MRTFFLRGAVFVGLALPVSAHALVWPDVPERVQRNLTAADPATRRTAAYELRTLGPARGTPLVLKALDDPEDEVKLAAADSAIRLRATGATDIVLAWLATNVRDSRMRKRACEVARAMPNPRAVAPLARSLGDPDQEVRQAAADALGHQANADAVAPLLGRLDDPAPAVRIQIVGALARLGDTRAVVPLVGKIQDSSPDVRQAVARSLGDLSDPRASSALLLALRDNNPEVKREALASLGRLRAPDAVDAITPFVAERGSTLRAAALTALGKIASPAAIKVLVGALGTADDAGGGLDRTPVRDALLAAGPSAVPALRAVLESPSAGHVATSAAWILGELHAASEAPAIVTAMRKGTLPAPAALRALASTGSASAIAVVLEFVGDASPVTRAEALRAANKLLDPTRPDGRAVEPLAAALRASRPTLEERVALVGLLGRTGAPRAAPLLKDLVSAREPVLRLAAIDALGVLGPAGVDDDLLGALGHESADVRLHAAVALSESGSAKARDALLKKLDATDEGDRTVVLTALSGVLARAPSDEGIARVAKALETAAGPERDALIEIVGRTPGAAAMKVLEGVAKSPSTDDRRVLATVLPARTDGTPLGRALLADSDASVRAQAAWALGAFADASIFSALDAASKSTDVDLAVNATAALGRIASRTKTADAAVKLLCPHLSDLRPYVRANALTALSRTGSRCGSGIQERKLLGDDPNDVVRFAAATMIGKSNATPDDKRALEKCAANDVAGAVVQRCRLGAPTQAAPPRLHAALVYVFPEGASSPKPLAAYTLELPDGFLRAGTADRRGAAFDPAVPTGDLTLRRASVLLR